MVLDADRITADRIGNNGLGKLDDRDVIQRGRNARHLARLDNFGCDVSCDVSSPTLTPIDIRNMAAESRILVGSFIGFNGPHFLTAWQKGQTAPPCHAMYYC